MGTRDRSMASSMALPELHKFPRTPHLASSFVRDADDSSLSAEETQEVLNKPLLIQEKMDGANIGISFQDGQLFLQSRGHFLMGGDHPQFDYLKKWAYENYEALYGVLGEEGILYGELLFARHSVPYDELLSYVVFFDLMDKKTGDYLSFKQMKKRLGEHFDDVDSITPPVVAEMTPGYLETLDSLIGKSACGDIPMEGLYLRYEDGGKTVERYKYVSKAFKNKVDESQHWSKGKLVKNNLK